MTLTEFNTKIADDVEELYTRLNAAGTPVTPMEAKALWCIGWAAIADMVEHAEGREMLITKAKELAAEAEAENR
ncbi:MAG: hypothetical protein V3S71_02795 [Acidobacteriota bacterium]